MKKILGICDSEIDYAELLHDNLSRRETFPFEISTFENVENLRKALAKGIISVLLIAQNMKMKIKDAELSTVKVIVLKEGVLENGDIPSIWKYQSAECIRKELLAIISNNPDMECDINISGHRNTKVIGIYTMFSMKLLSIYSIAAGITLAKNSKTLLISMKGMSHVRNLLRSKEDKDITDLIYYLRNGSDKFMLSFEGMVMTYLGMDYIQPAYSYIDSKSVSEDDWIKLLEEIKHMGEYDNVIVELSSDVNGLLEIFRKCDCIIWPCEQGDSELRTAKELLDILTQNEYEDIITKINQNEMPIDMQVPKRIEDITSGSFMNFANDEIKARVINAV